MKERRGVYFLANDRVLDQAIAFLNSFRRYNPVMPLCLVPFAVDCSAVTALRHRYGFSVWADEEALARCDALSRLFHGHTLGHYRKFVMWLGDFDEFTYIDCDTVVLEPVDTVFGLLDGFDVVTAYSNAASSRRWVWRDSIDTIGGLDERQTGFAANTGFVLSRAGLLPLDDVIARAPEALALAPHMELSCFEQPALNYMIVTSGGAYTSLSVLASAETRATGRAGIPIERWAGEAGMVVRDGRIVSPERPATLFVHWAGLWDESRRTGRPLPYRELFDFYRHLWSGGSPTAS